MPGNHPVSDEQSRLLRRQRTRLSLVVGLVIALLLVDAVVFLRRLTSARATLEASESPLRWALVFALIGASLFVSISTIVHINRAKRMAAPVPAFTRQERKELLEQLRLDSSIAPSDPERLESFARSLTDVNSVLVLVALTLMLTSQAVSPSPSSVLVTALFTCAIAPAAVGIVIFARNGNRGMNYLMTRDAPGRTPEGLIDH